MIRDKKYRYTLTYQKDLEPAAAVINDDRSKPFVWVNYAAIFLHLVSAVAQMVLYLPKDPSEFSYTESYLKWGEVKNGTVCEGVIFNTTNDGEFCVQPEMERICEDDESGLHCGVDLGWLIISFFLLSFFFQGIAALTDFVEDGVCGYKYFDMIQKGLNPLRFLEYSISASVMLVAIAVLNGVFDINLVASIAVLTCSCQLSGLVVEYLLQDDRDDLGLLAHLNGWLTLGCAYGIIFHAYFKSAAEGDTDPPAFVDAIVISLCALYCCFGATQITELFCRCRCSFVPEDDDNDKKRIITQKKCKACCDASFGRISCGTIRCRNKDEGRCDHACKELSYVILSLAAKSVLGWIIFSNVLLAPRS
tara:strand:+ start:1654 stop:2742 length:1089 start_codon:yes stop_codon:yes gene_type:complete